MPAEPRYGEVWSLTREAGHSDADRELCLIVSSDALGRLPRRIVAALQPSKGQSGALWEVAAGTIRDSELPETLVVDATRLESVDCSECAECCGRLDADLMSEVAAAIAILVEAEL